MQTVTTASRKPLLHKEKQHQKSQKLKEKSKLFTKHLAKTNGKVLYF